MKSTKTGYNDDEFARLTPGQRLAAVREAQGQSIDDVVRHTKLSRRQIMALESDAHDQLPGPVFVRGFMRNYARHLQLDAAPLLAALNLQATPGVELPGGAVEPADSRPEVEKPLSAHASETTSEPDPDSVRDSVPHPIAKPAIDRDRAGPVMVDQGIEPGIQTFSDVVSSMPAGAAQGGQDVPAAEPDTFGASGFPSADTFTRSAAAAESDAAAADETRSSGLAEPVDSLDGIAATSKAWRNYALVSLAVVIGLIALVLVTQT